jgi:Holliday junction resolvase RusA-like endonuclease
MIARLWIPNMVPMSKQHSRGYAANGRTFTDRKYGAARHALFWEAKAALEKQGWTTPVEERCTLRVSYRGRFDVDNAGGFVQDALQGAAYVRDSQVVMATYRKRLKGPMGLSIIIHTLEGRQ